MITITKTGNGVTNPAGIIYPEEFSDVTIVGTPNPGNRVKEINVRYWGVDYKFPLYTELRLLDTEGDYTVEFVFEEGEQQTFNITVTSNAYGAITPVGNQIVNYAGSCLFTFQPNVGCYVKDVKVNGTSIGQVATYEFIEVIENKTLEVVFDRLDNVANVIRVKRGQYANWSGKTLSDGEIGWDRTNLLARIGNNPDTSTDFDDAPLLGVPEAPIDNVSYVRRNGIWTPGSGGGATYLKDLVDVVDGLAPNEGQILVYSGGMWNAGTPSAGAWGSISGSISNQTDLKNALDTKLSGSSVFNDLSDVVLSNLEKGDVIWYDGTNFINLHHGDGYLKSGGHDGAVSWSNPLEGFNALEYKGAIDCSSDPLYPTASIGDTYKISAGGKIGGDSGPSVVTSDMIICSADTVAGDHATVGANWSVFSGESNGGVIGPVSSVSGNFASFPNSGGAEIADSGYNAGSFAPSNKGVTNGDSHNHDGGDGGQISYNSLSDKPTLGNSASRNVGTTSGTVAAGDHDHAGIYQPLDEDLTALAGLTGVGTVRRLGNGSFSIQDYSLPIASPTTIGGFKVGSGLEIEADGTLNVTGGSGGATALAGLSDVIDTLNPSSGQIFRFNGTYWDAATPLALGELETDAYRGDRGKVAYDHSLVSHAPSNAQKNSDITKEEIEAKLIGEITSHSHAGNGLVKVSSNDTTLGLLSDKIVAGSNVTVTVNNDGGNETISISSTGGGGLDEAPSNDKTYGRRNAAWVEITSSGSGTGDVDGGSP